MTTMSGPAASERATNRSQVLQPSGWPQPKGYANGMMAEGRLVVTGGVVGWDAASRFADGFVAPVRQAFENIVAILAEGGAGPEHLVRLTWYVVDMDEYVTNLKRSAKPIAKSWAFTIPAWHSCRSCVLSRHRRASRSKRLPLSPR